MYTDKHDVTNPPLEEVDNAMYRVNLCDYPGSNCHDDVYIEDESEFLREECDNNDDTAEDMPVIEETGVAPNHGAHVLKIRIRVPKALHGFLIGKKGQTRFRLEYETKTRIVIPKRDEEGDIVVTSSTEKYLRSVYPLLRSLIENGRDILGPTHFVSVPFNTPSIRERFEILKDQVLKYPENNSDIINNTLFTRAEKLHLTLTCLTLLDDEERSTSRHTLDECLKSVIEPLLMNRPIVVQVRGITIMNDDPTHTRVLFAKVESPTDILQKLADEVHNFFLRDGLTKRDRYERDHVKLHVTLMNTRYLLKETVESGTSSKQRSNITFDASKILEDFHDFDFGVAAVNSLHLSQMGAYSEDGYYLSSNRIKWA